jgi:SAM-dependent methyltransferase
VEVAAVSDSILDPLYWRNRLNRSSERHHSIYRCPLELWRRIEEQHRRILGAHIKTWDSVLDCGCGYGRLLSLMPVTWRGLYWGVDLSPDFIEVAKRDWPGRVFMEASLTDLPATLPHFDWAVLISIRPMVRRELGDDVWNHMEQEIRKHASRLLFLEYDVNDEGSIE